MAKKRIVVLRGKRFTTQDRFGTDYTFVSQAGLPTLLPLDPIIIDKIKKLAEHVVRASKRNRTKFIYFSIYIETTGPIRYGGYLDFKSDDEDTTKQVQKFNTPVKSYGGSHSKPDVSDIMNRFEDQINRLEQWIQPMSAPRLVKIRMVLFGNRGERPNS